MKFSLSFALPPLVALFGLAANLTAGEARDPVVPSAELASAAAMDLDGPSETTGIGEVKVLAEQALDGELDGLQGYVMRAREITLLPGGKVAVHQHDARPGMAYMVEGEAVEHRNDSADPLLRREGEVAVEHSGIVHWWENVSDQPAKVVVVDIVRLEK